MPCLRLKCQDQLESIYHSKGVKTQQSNILFLSFSDHWCAPPEGQEPAALGLTLDEWKKEHLPMDLGSDNMSTPSTCRMYDFDHDSWENFDKTTRHTKDCDSWSYDQRSVHARISLLL